MSIYTSYSTPTTSLQRKPVKPSPLGKGNPSTKSGASIKFGLNGFWPTTEFIKKSGGLGEVSRSIPAAFSKYSDHDLRVICPYEEDPKNPRATEGFAKTNLTITLKTEKGQTHRFEVHQKFEPAPNAEHGEGNWIYALKSPIFAEDAEDTSAPQTGLSEFTYTGENQESAKKVFLFNQAAAELVNHINNPTKRNPAISRSQSGTQLETFTGPADQSGKVNFVIGNDWLTGPMLYQKPMQQKANENIRKVFMLHNTYDNEQGGGFFDYNGLPIPKTLKTVHDQLSPLHMALASADVVIGNKNYVKTISQTPFSKGSRFVETLKDHSAAGRVHDIHHGLAEDYDARTSPALIKHQGTAGEPADIPNARAYQFVQLQGEDLGSAAAWNNFKRDNKAALQAKLGLNNNPDATILSWAARLDPFQKGFYTVKNTMERLLEENENLQIVVAGRSEEPSIQQWITEMSHKYPGRLYMPNQFVNKDFITQINAGSDFVMLPSLYEPYGLTQLEAMKMGAIPIVHGVDGIRSSVSDPDVNGRDFIGPDGEGHEHAWDAGQTGILMRPMAGEEEVDISGNDGTLPYKQVAKAIDVPRYRKALDYESAMLNIEAFMPELTGGKSKDQRLAESIEQVKQKSAANAATPDDLKKLAETLKEAHKTQEKRASSFKKMIESIDKIRRSAYRFNAEQLTRLRNVQFALEEAQKKQTSRTKAIQKLDLKALAKELNQKAKTSNSKLTPSQQTKLAKIKLELEKTAPSIPATAKDEVFDPIIRQIVVAPSMQPAEDSFLDAVGRAMGMPEETRRDVRGNAVRYVNAAHSWEGIVDRYDAILTSDSDYKAPATEFYAKSPFAAKKELVKDKPINNNSPQRPAPQSKGAMEQALEWFLFLLQPWKWFA